MTPPPRLVVMVAELDSVAQADRVLRNPGPDRLREQFTGYLRTAGLIADEIVLTDAQLLDGSVLLQLGPRTVSEMLAAAESDTRIRVLGRRTSLADCLRVLAADPGSGRMRPFEWSCLRGQGLDVGELSRRLPAVSAVRVLGAAPVDVPAAVADALVLAGVDPDVTTRLQERWEAWIRDADGLLQVERWNDAPFDLRAAADDTPWPNDLTGEPPVLSELFATSHGDPPVRERSRLRTAIHALETSADDRRLLLQWADSAYSLALGRNHGASWLTLGGTPPPSGARAERLGSDLVEHLAAMPGAVAAAARFEARGAVAEWRSKPTAWRLYEVNRIVALRFAPADPRGDRRWTATRFALGAVAVAGGIAGQFTAPALAAVAAGLTALSLLPDAVQLWRSTRSPTAAWIHLTGMAPMGSTRPASPPPPG